MRKLIIGSLFAAALGGLSSVAEARTNVDLVVNFGPPPVQYEYVPPPRVGWVWAPGYWDWRHDRYHWIRGHWVRERPGYDYAPTRWVEYGGRWHNHRGGWRWRDSDHDGVPNGWDRRPHNPRRY